MNREQRDIDYIEAQERLGLLTNYYRWIASYFRKHISGVVLELGCGSGNLLPHYLNRAESVIAVDNNPELLRRLESKYSSDRIRTLVADLRGDWSELSGLRADTALALDVMEHVEDHHLFARGLQAHLVPGGKALIKVPAQSRLFGDADVASGHFLRYDPEVLREVMESAGFSTLRLRYFNPVGAISYRLKRHRKTVFSRTFRPWQLKIINALLPLVRLFGWIPVKGLSLIGIFEA